MGESIQGYVFKSAPSLKIKYSAVWEEWQVQVFDGLFPAKEVWYHTSDEQDARDTAKHMKMELGIS